MSIKQIPFNTEDVRATLYNRKTTTRRPVKEPYYIDDPKVCKVAGLALHRGTNATHGMPFPDRPYNPGDILYVRETWCNVNKPGIEPDYYYFADMEDVEDYDPKEWTWRPSIHMPKEAARIFLRVTDVRVERVQDIPREDTVKEGAPCRARLYGGYCGNGGLCDCDDYKREFSALWDSTIKPADRDLYGWDANPWVWVIEFERISKEEAIKNA